MTSAPTQPAAGAGDSLPIIGHADLDAPLAWRDGRPLAARQFVADALGTAQRLPPGCDVLNLCQDRYRFAVTFAATLIARRTCLFPQNQTERVLEQIIQAHANGVAIVEAPLARCPVEQVRFSEIYDAQPAWSEVPRIPGSHLAALVFTSGSTGVPRGHYKEWGRLVAGAHAEREALGLVAPFHVLGTVPPQHMYGFESTVLLPLLSGGSFHVGRPLFPSDVAQALNETPAPRVLVTAPIHVRACVEAETPMPPVAMIVSAAAPLGHDLAAHAEERFATRVMEIYGFTEAGMVAVRRTTQGKTWLVMPGVELVQVGEDWAFTAGHVHGVKVATDLIEPRDRRTFVLGGRRADIVDVAGKRASLADLSHKLMEIAGVEDGVFHRPEGQGAPVPRLMAFVVAPTLSVGQIRAALRQRIDPAFLPRPLVKLDRLPRNASGKMTLETLRALEAGSVAAARAHGAGRHGGSGR